ncbi:cytochrome P450 [Streptomyces sp. DSM 44917]|uniref:Cytochrome P450 n=1 Tax=Streptomyces boetiae TaxID=3075541 RepID=A0ABU2LCZ9_9ACTN|nr:cytochrome P450 [Streptomyces sp. DSM 44917]MDT0309454.1 cytochrome P450 [Streptomyces sp. DSM 44917]
MPTPPAPSDPSRPSSPPPATAVPAEAVPLHGEAYKRDPAELYRELRERGPVHRVAFPSGVHAWLVTGYEAAHRTLNDERLGKNHALGNDAWRARASIMPEPQHSQLQVHLLHQDPPRHTAMRRLITDAFAPRRVAELHPRIQAIADELLDAALERAGSRTDAEGAARLDLVADFAAHFPFRVLAEVIGLASEPARRFDRDWGKVVQPVGPTDPGRPLYEGRLRGLQSYIDEVTASQRTHPSEALLGRLVAAQEAGALTKEELDSIVFQLLVAGQEPVTNQITTSVLALLRHPDQLDRLREDPGLLPRAVEELLRYDAAFELTTWRFFAEDSDLYGTRIPAGDSVIVSLWAANRDPDRFPEPDALDLGRAPQQHLAFGHGIHFCPGASLARVELQVALGTLLRRLPGLRADFGAEEPRWIRAVLARGVDALPVAFRPGAGGAAPAGGCPVHRLG